MKKLLASLLAFAMVVTGLYIVKPADVKAATTVDKTMLGVEAAVTADKVDGKYIIRFVSTVDSLNYKNVGFDLTYPDGSTETITMKRVFQKIDSSIGALDNGAEDVFTLSPNVISKNSKYFMTTKVVVNDEAGNYSATAFCTTKDGTKVTGATKVVSVSDLQGKTVNVTVPVAFAENATLTATYGDKTAASATLLATGEGYSVVRIQLADNAEAASLKSVTKFTVSDGTTSKDVLYRNYNTSVANGADTSWYDVNPSATEYTIATSADLFGLAKLVNDGVQSFAGKKIYLVSDITVNTGDAASWGETAPAYAWTSIGNATNKFKGVLDGCGNAISGIYLSGTVEGVGFVGYAGAGCELKNFKLVNSYLLAARYQADGETTATKGNVGLVGIADSVKISNVYNAANVHYWGGSAAGFVGKAEGNVELNGCWFAGHLVHYSGAFNAVFVGNVNKQATIKIANCLMTGKYTNYSDSTVTGNHSAALVGFSNVGATVDIDNCVLLGTLDIQDTAPGKGAITGYLGDNEVVTLSNIYLAAAKVPATLHRYLPTGAVLTNVQKVEASVLKNLSAAEIKAFLPVLSGESTSAWTTAKDGSLILKAFQSWLYPTAPVADEWVDEPETPEVSEPETHVPDTSWYKDSETEFTLTKRAQLYGLAELAKTKNFAGKTIKLGKNITLNDNINVAAWKTTAPAGKWTPIGSTTLPFAGTFDGQGYKLSGLYLNATTAKSGLFGSTAGTAVIKNFKLVDSYMHSTADYLGMIGFGTFDTMENVYTNAVIDTEGNYVAGFIGTLEGSGKEIYIKNCWFDGTITQTTGEIGSVGGFIGVTAAATGDVRPIYMFQNCLSSGTLSGVQRVGGFIGWHNYGNKTTTSQIVNCLSVANVPASGTKIGMYVGDGNTSGKTTVTTSYTTGTVFGQGASISAYTYDTTNMFKTKNDFGAANLATLFPGSTAWEAVSGSTPILKGFEDKADPTPAPSTPVVPQPEPETHVPDTSWYSDSATEFTLTKRAELYGLAELAKTKNFAGKTIKLGKDIALNDNINVATWKTTAPAGKWTPIGSATLPFAGTFDGQGYKISGLYLNATTAKAGFFGETATAAVICNFKLVDSYMTTTAQYIGLVGYGSFTKIENVYTNAVINSSSDYVGGFVGSVLAAASSAEQVIKNCWFDGTITQTTGEIGAVGGFTGGDSGATDRPNVSFVDCLSTGSVTGTTRVGGFVGWSAWGAARNFNNCLSLATVNGGAKVGSFIGEISTSRVPTFTSTNYTTGSVVLGLKNTSAAFTYPDTVCTTESALKSASVATLFPGSTAWEAVSGSTPVLKGLK